MPSKFETIMILSLKKTSSIILTLTVISVFKLQYLSLFLKIKTERFFLQNCPICCEIYRGSSQYTPLFIVC